MTALLEPPLAGIFDRMPDADPHGEHGAAADPLASAFAGTGQHGDEWPGLEFAQDRPAVMPFAYPLVFPVRGWHVFCHYAYSLLPNAVRSAIETPRGNAVFLHADGAVTHGHVEWWPERAPEAETEGAPIEVKGDGFGSEQEAIDYRIANEQSWAPSPLEIIAAAAEVRAGWSVRQRRKAIGKLKGGLSRTALFGNMADRSNDPGDD